MNGNSRILMLLWLQNGLRSQKPLLALRDNREIQSSNLPISGLGTNQNIAHITGMIQTCWYWVVPTEFESFKMACLQNHS